MVKLIQTKYIKQLFIFLVFAFLLSYQQNANAGRADEVRTSMSISTGLQIMANNGVPPSSIQEDDSSKTRSSAFNFRIILAVGGEDSTLLDNYEDSQSAFRSILVADTDTYDAQIITAATIMTVDALSLLVGLIDELIVLEDTGHMQGEREEIFGDDANNPIAGLASGLVQIAAYEELFEGIRGFIRSGLNISYRVPGTRNGIDAMRGAFESSSDYLSDGALQQTPECSNLFCSLYTLRRENPDISINEFTMTQILLNEVFDGFIVGNPSRYMRHEVQKYIAGDEINRHLNSLRQSRAATETVLPGNDPNPYQAPVISEPVISEECRMAPSLPGC